MNPAIIGGTLTDTHQVVGDGVSIYMGRYANASLGFYGPQRRATPIPGSIALDLRELGLSDLSLGRAHRHRDLHAGRGDDAHEPEQHGGHARHRDAQRELHRAARSAFNANVSIPSTGGNNGGTWNMNATNVPFSFNTFSASTSDHLTITNGTTSSATNQRSRAASRAASSATDSTAAILGYGINDRTSTNPSNWNNVTGVAALTGPRQNNAAAYREGRVSDPAGTLQTLHPQLRDHRSSRRGDLRRDQQA